MTPFFFGARQRRLFGVYQPAEGTRARARAVVLCPPWGAEYLYAHRSVRQLSQMLNAVGLDTLRFDYFGTGDSGGDMTDGDVAGWVGDIATAAEEIRSIAAVDEVSLVGLRLGALLAARLAADRRQRIASLVLWDPVASGRDYPAEVHAACEANALLHEPPAAKRPTARAVAKGGGYDYDGFTMSAALEDDIAGLDLAALASGLPRRTLLVASNDADRAEAARVALAARPDVADATVALPYLPHWIEDWPARRQEVPVAALRAIREWLA